MICVGCGNMLIPSYCFDISGKTISTGYYCHKCKNKYDLEFHARIVEEYQKLKIEHKNEKE